MNHAAPTTPELNSAQIGLGGLFAATTGCAILAAIYAQFGFWGLMAAIDVLVVVIGVLRYLEYDRAVGIPLPPWSVVETVVVLVITVWLQLLALPPVTCTGYRQFSPTVAPATAPATPAGLVPTTSPAEPSLDAP